MKNRRSNARVAKQHDLAVSLAGFSAFAGGARKDPVAMWAGIRQALEESMPPCLLSCPASLYKADERWCVLCLCGSRSSGRTSLYLVSLASI